MFSIWESESAEMSFGAVGAFSSWFVVVAACVWGVSVGVIVGWYGGVANVVASRENTRNDAPSTDLGRGEVNVPVIGFVSLS